MRLQRRRPQFGKDSESGRDYSDYELYVTGHSLGGGLAQLTGFALAGSEKCTNIPSPITTISFASPTAGDEEYNKAFQVRSDAIYLNQYTVISNSLHKFFPFRIWNEMDVSVISACRMMVI